MIYFATLPDAVFELFSDRVFLADTLNFSFWSSDESKKFRVKYEGEQHTGYWSLCAALNRAIDVSTSFSVCR